jgi:hypothetical protein
MKWQLGWSKKDVAVMDISGCLPFIPSGLRMRSRMISAAFQMTNDIKYSTMTQTYHSRNENLINPKIEICTYLDAVPVSPSRPFVKHRCFVVWRKEIKKNERTIFTLCTCLFSVPLQFYF